MNVHEFAELSAGHAVAALSPEDEQAYQDALAAHPEWRGIVEADAETAAALAEGAAPVSPPLGARSALLRAIAVEPAGAAPGVEPLGAVDATSRQPADAEATVAMDAVASVPAEVSEVDEPGEDAEAAEPAGPAGPAEPAEPAPRTEPVSPPTEVVQAVQRRNWSRGVFVLVASIALLVGIGWGTGAIADLWRTPTAVTALEQIEAAPDAAAAQTDFGGGTATVHWSPSVGKVVLVAEGLPTLPSDRTFELWYVRGDAPISAGTFAADGTAATAELAGTMEPGDTIAVTVEPAGGAPGGAPTTDPLFAIPTA
ncbi:anti-sigma factor [Microbacterium lacticum]|uniref:anti-sigma factor n=1 Tax=Microbacterium lacticum TaxID=33885 RepID=UPI0024328818|nr:anti-sigma factor [Microbacterium lacticum]